MPEGRKLKAREQLELLAEVLASGWIKTWDYAIDGGANIGDWSIEMAAKFQNVIAFEPGDVFTQLSARTGHLPNIVCYRAALLDRATTVEMVDPRGAGKNRSFYVQEKADGAIVSTTIDAFGLVSCGLIKLDLEGAEPLALLGAKATIARCRPILIVEIERHSSRFGYTAEAVHKLIIGMGYSENLQRGPDTVFIPRG